MRCIYWISRSLLLLIIVVGASHRLSSQDKIALLMGVADYPASSGWPSTFAFNDLSLIKETLIKRGFNEKYIYTILDSACTGNGIRNAFTSQLIPELKEGTSVYIHFSGLGLQIKDTDEDEEDGLDEVIIPYDAPAKNPKGNYDTDLFIADDELENWFRQIQKKLGPNGQLVVSVDVYSIPFAAKEKYATRGGNETMSEDSESDNANVFFSKPFQVSGLAPLICLYCSATNQITEEFYSDEEESFGLFSFALSKTMLQMDKNASYQEWFEKIRTIMNQHSSLQDPILLGEKALKVFNGRLADKKDHFRINQQYSKDLVLIDDGKLQQIEKGTEFLFYDESVSDTVGVDPIAKGVIENARLMEAELRVIESSVNPLPKNSKLFISSFHYKALSIKVHIDLNGTPIEKKLMSHFSFSPFIDQVEEKPELLVIKSKSNHLQLKTKSGEILYQEEWNKVSENKIPFTLNDKIAEYLRANFMRSLEIDHDGKGSELECLIVKDRKEYPMDGIRNKIAVGSKIKLRVTNHSQKGLYFGIIDIQPDQQINVIIPHDKPAESYYLEAGQSYTTDFELEVSPPYGKEFIKVIMMANPLDLRPVIATRGVSNLLKEGVKNPFEILLGNTFIEHPVTAGEQLKINVSEISNMTGVVLEIREDL
jgi:hypothetical protein